MFSVLVMAAAAAFSALFSTLLLSQPHFVASSSGTCSVVDNYKVITEILSFEMPAEQQHKCDPDCPVLRFLVYLDLDDPEEPQALTINEVRYTEIFTTSQNSIAFMPVQLGGKIIAKASCGKPFQGANLRVLLARDVDENPLIESFSCIVPKTAPTLLSEEATWSPMTSCDPGIQKGTVELTFRYKVVEVLTSQCCLS
ncbi:hypothetical protein BV898_05777 [Hypsibius exemplaris]|uniref:MD-2-related lipid-recognition domain-containing protein n=1 Tax=Hypsibius exemplaris TaxID=2072580 RepID=A0A1W0WYE3_HYPEX|nr:hypothetical protein BV898_05777 [Hypsibius exemplaris]